LRNNPDTPVLVTTPGAGSVASVLQANVDTMEALINLNITALTRLTYAAAQLAEALFDRAHQDDLRGRFELAAR